MNITSEQDVAATISDATGPLAIRGGGTRQIGNPVVGQELSTAGLSGIELYEPGSLTIVAKTGTPLSEIEHTLAGESQRLAFEPMDHRGLLGSNGTPTIGGVVAANVSGPRRIQTGACRDHLLGVRFVDGQGTVLKNGGRVMKNVTGYDLVKLLAGSYGTLGVLSEVALKVLPKTDMTAAILVKGLSDVDAQRAMSNALNSPFDVTGVAHDPAEKQDDATTMIRVEGFENSVKYRVEQMKSLLAEFGDVTVETDPATCAKIWKSVRDVEVFHQTQGDVWRISVKPTDGPHVGANLGADALLYDWGGGLIWALMPPGSNVREKMSDFNGHATLVRASELTRARLGAFHPEPTPLAAITHALRKKFDPRGILNPGLMG